MVTPLAGFASDRRRAGCRADAAIVADFKRDRQQLIRRLARTPCCRNVRGCAATETYLADLTRYTDVTSRVLMASAMGVAVLLAQHQEHFDAWNTVLSGVDAAFAEVTDAQHAAILYDVLGEHPVPAVFAQSDLAAS